VPFASASTSSSEVKGTIGATGPKISSSVAGEPAGTSSSTVGG